MRFELREADGRPEFWVFDVEDRFQHALERLWWGSRRAEGWCKAFDPDAHHIRRAFGNLKRLLGPALRQLTGVDEVPWQDALAEVCQRFAPEDVDWWLTGSAALAVRGAGIVPLDLDLIISEADSVRAGDLLVDGLIEPASRGEWDLSQWWGRAFIGARVEWAGGMTAAADQPLVTDFGPAAAARLEPVRWRHWDIRLPPLDLQRAVCQRRGLDDRVALIDLLMAASQERPAGYRVGKVPRSGS